MACSFALLIVACSPRQPQPSPTPQVRATPPSTVVSDSLLRRVSDRVTKLGARGYFAQLAPEDPDWLHLLDRITKGDEQALALAPRLRPGADAGTAEELDASIAQALPHAPLAVLKLTDAGWPVASLCTSPFIEPEPGVEARYNKAALAALDRVPVRERPQPAFSRCRAALVAIGGEL